MFCSNCGNEVQNGAAFCPKCGQKMPVMNQSGNAGLYGNPQMNYNGGYQAQGNGQIPYSQRPWTKYLWAVPGILMPLAGFIIAIVMTSKKRKMDALVSVAGALIGMIWYIWLYL